MLRRIPNRTVHLGLTAVIAMSLLNGCGDPASIGGGPAVADRASDTSSVPDTTTGADVSTKGASAAGGRWEAQQELVNKDGLKLSPASAANLPDGKVLLWSADGRLTFGGDTRSFTAVLDPSTGAYTEKLMTESPHNLFCPGTSNLPDGRILVSGGSQSAVTTVYDPATGRWRRDKDMVIGRGYQANTVLRDGSVLTLGGTWGAPLEIPKNGERWTASGGWSALPGVLVEDAITDDAGGVYRADNHMWLIPTGNGKVLHAGPSAKMHWITTEGRGDIVFAGRRGDDEDAMLGTAVMFDTGRILKVGGARNYSSDGKGGTLASRRAYLIDARHGLSVTRLKDASYARSMLSSVVLPNGQVMLLGGMSEPLPFRDDNSVLVAELYDPATRSFTVLKGEMNAPRNYHSTALLLADARVLIAGGNLGNPNTVHNSYQIYTPGYLLTASGKPAARPKIVAAPTEAVYGTSVTVSTDGPVTSMALVRLSSATHQVNNDQRRVSLGFSQRGVNTYSVTIPSNPGWLVPGDYMLFAMNADGVPSIARTVRIGGAGVPMVARVEDQRDPVGVPVSLRATATGSGVEYTVTGQPPGVDIDPTTGVFRGAPSREGRFRVTVTARNSAGATSTEFVWTVGPSSATRYVRLEATGPDVGGGPWASMAEISVIDVWGNRLPSADWSVSASSAQGGFPATAAIDGNPATMWHTRWSPAKPPGTHHFTIDLGRSVRVGAISVLPRQDGSPNGTLRNGRVLVSDDGQDWSVAWEGDVSMLAVGATRVIRLNELARGRPAKQSSVYAGLDAGRALDGITSGDFGADRDITHTQLERTPWWQVDLGSVQTVTAVRLWNRTDCCADRLKNLNVFLSDVDMGNRSPADLANDPRVVTMSVPGTVARWAGLAPNGGPARARYVRVQLNGSDYLSLSEVQVFGAP